jgi:aminopeptidase
VKSLLRPDEAARYAEAVLTVGLSLRKGDDVILRCQPAHRELAAAIVEAGYRAGAHTVDVVLGDPVLRAARLRAAPEELLGELTPWTAARLRAETRETTVTLFIAGESEPGALEGIAPERIAADDSRPIQRLPDLRRAIRQGRRRWGIVAWPVAAWAERVYPNLSSDSAQRKLARELLWFCRLGPDDPPGVRGLRSHLDTLTDRAKALTRLRLRRLEVRGPGTDLRLALHPDTVWSGGGRKNGFGLYQAPNLPTEENFTSPEASATEGTFRCTRPLMYQGRLLEGLAGEFRGGRLVRLEAARAADRDWFADYLGSVDGADRLGEIALVDRSSRIGSTGRIYYNTLLDENAAAHMAFGSAFSHTRRKKEGERGRRGLNRSRIHVDVMIGSDDLEATGFTARGKPVPLIRDGAWVV